MTYSWMPKALKNLVENTGSRTQMNIMGALSLKDICRTVIREYDTINAENISRFFIAIRELYPITQKLHIILDGAGYHRSELVKDWAYVMNIELHYLPPYSPNLNPIERLWKLMGTSKNLMLGKSRREIRSGPKEIVCFLYLMCSQNTQIEQ